MADRLPALVLFVLYSDLSAPQSVYGLQNDVRTHSPTHVPAPEAKQPTEDELQEQVSRARQLGPAHASHAVRGVLL